MKLAYYCLMIKNDLRALPKTVRLQILVVLSLMWSVIFTLMFWSYKVWGLVLSTSVIGHVLVIIGVYFTMKSFKMRDNLIYEMMVTIAPQDLVKIYGSMVKELS